MNLEITVTSFADREIAEIGALAEELGVILDTNVEEILDALQKGGLLSEEEVSEILDEGSY